MVNNPKEPLVSPKSRGTWNVEVGLQVLPPMPVPCGTLTALGRTARMATAGVFELNGRLVSSAFVVAANNESAKKARRTRDRGIVRASKIVSFSPNSRIAIPAFRCLRSMRVDTCRSLSVSLVG